MLIRERTIQGGATDELEILQSDASASWFVLHTLSRQEKQLCEDLDDRFIRHFLPLVTKTHYYGRRKVVAELPLFPGYLFMLGSIEQAYSADRTGRVARILPVSDQDQLNWEMRNLQIALHRKAVLDIYPNLRAARGSKCGRGHFGGCRG